jgi:hypothetical protein
MEVCVKLLESVKHVLQKWHQACVVQLSCSW